jgi:hypothetical protein
MPIDSDTFSSYTVSVVYYLNEFKGWSQYKAVSISEDYGCHRYRWYDGKVPLISMLNKTDPGIHTMIWIHSNNEQPTRLELNQMSSTDGINLYCMNPSGIWYMDEEEPSHTPIDVESMRNEDLMEALHLKFVDMSHVLNLYKKDIKFTPQKPIEKNVNYIYTK